MEQQNNAAKYAFFYMLSLVALTFMAISSGMIIFQIINKKIIDVITQNNIRFSPDQLKFAISAVIISTPIYYLTMRQIFKNLFSGALQKDSGIRKWLTYFILLVASVVMIGWLIGTINSFLNGELTVKFILKAITAIAIAAVIFSFYFYDIKREEVAGNKDKMVQVYFYCSLAAVIAIFISSLFFVETPAATRNRKMDEEIINRFSLVDNSINNYYQDNKKLPTNLDALLNQSPTIIVENDIKNPISGEKFGYKATGKNTYELCADFKSSNQDNQTDQYLDKRWLHNSGYQCIKLKAAEVNTIGTPQKL